MPPAVSDPSTDSTRDSSILRSSRHPATTPTGVWRPDPQVGLSAQPLVEWIESQSADQRLFAMFHTRAAHFPFVVEPPPAGQDPTGIWAALWGDDLNPLGRDWTATRVSGGTQVQAWASTWVPMRCGTRSAALDRGTAGLAVPLCGEHGSTRPRHSRGHRCPQAYRTVGKDHLIAVADHGESSANTTSSSTGILTLTASSGFRC